MMTSGAKGEMTNGATCLVPSKRVSVTMMLGGAVGPSADIAPIMNCAPMRMQPVEKVHKKSSSMIVSALLMLFIT